MGQALYLKYRPRTFEQVEGQDHVTRTLRNALEMGRVAHAYLFSGPRGTGKTSTARILAKAVNCLSETEPRPCNECVICRAINEERLLDLIEIDAASNTGVDDIRDLRDKVDFKPGEARYKVYIIDEAHMLSTAAFNALLKTLEEPPPHVIFVLATTEPNKIPATISSRCQRFDFRRATLPELVERLGFIAEQEELRIEPAAVELIARQATGSFRDAASLLDQLMAFGGIGGSETVTLAQVEGLLGASSPGTIHRIISALAARDVALGISLIGVAVDAGADPRQLARELVEYLRGVLLFQVGGSAALALSAETRDEMAALSQTMSAGQILRAVRLFNQAALELRNSVSPTLPLEMALAESGLELDAPAPHAPPPERAAAARPAVVHHVPQPPPGESKRDKPRAQDRKVSEEPPGSPHELAATAAPPAAEGEVTLETVVRAWPAILARVRKLDKKLEAYLHEAQPVAVSGNLITIGLPFDLHTKQVEESKARPQFEKILADLLGKPFHYKCILSPKKQKMKAAEDDPVVRAAMDLGGRIQDVS